MNGRKRKTKGSSVKDSIARVLQKKPHGQQQEQQQRQKMTQNKKKGMGASKVVIVEVINGEAPQPRKYRKSITVKQFLHLRFRHRPEVLLAHWHFVFTSPDGFYARTVLQNQQRYYPGLAEAAVVACGRDTAHEALTALDELFAETFGEDVEPLDAIEATPVT